MLAGALDLLQIVRCLRGHVLHLFRQIGVTDDGVHGGADVVAHVGEEGALGPAAGLRVELLRLHALLPLHHGAVEVEHDHKRDHNDQHLHPAVARHVPGDLVHLLLEVEIRVRGVLLVQNDTVFRQLRHIVAAQLAQNPVGSLMGGLPQPEHGGEEDHKEERHPHRRAFAEAVPGVLAEHAAKEQEAQNAPHDQNQIGGHGQTADRPEVRHHEIEEKQQRNPGADEARGLIEALPVLPRQLEGGG